MAFDDDPWSRDVPHDPNQTEEMANKYGTFVACAADDEAEYLRPHLVRALKVAACLTPRQLQVLWRFVAGMGQTEIARDLGVAQPTIHEALFGKPVAGGGRHGGILKKVAEVAGPDTPPDRPADAPSTHKVHAPYGAPKGGGTA